MSQGRGSQAERALGRHLTAAGAGGSGGGSRWRWQQAHLLGQTSGSPCRSQSQPGVYPAAAWPRRCSHKGCAAKSDRGCRRASRPLRQFQELGTVWGVHQEQQAAHERPREYKKHPRNGRVSSQAAAACCAPKHLFSDYRGPADQVRPIPHCQGCLGAPVNTPHILKARAACFASACCQRLTATTLGHCSGQRRPWQPSSRGPLSGPSLLACPG